jgi:glycosyltransferase involved in cell wall biosynthesis
MKNTNPRFTIIIVTNVVNTELFTTINSALEQKWSDFEVIVKSNELRNVSLEARYKEYSRLTVISQRDKGIYDAMNQAIAHAQGRFTFFLNVGDRFYNDAVLQNIAKYAKPNIDVIYAPYIYRGVNIKYPKNLSRWFFLRNALCHQSYFLKTKILKSNNFDLCYSVLADHELMLRCIDIGSVNFQFAPRPISILAPMGFSKKKSELKKIERSVIEKKYFSTLERFVYLIFKVITLRFFRQWLLRSDFGFSVYYRLRGFLLDGIGRH